MSKALCYINRHAHTAEGKEKLDTRILVINATPGSNGSADSADSANVDGMNGSAPTTHKTKINAKVGTGGMRGGYVGLMNCVFAAQKQKVPIDVLSLPPPHTASAPPIFLQQASYLTEGVWWRWNGRGGIVQYLHVSGIEWALWAFTLQSDRVINRYRYDVAFDSSRDHADTSSSTGDLPRPAITTANAGVSAAGRGGFQSGVLLSWRCGRCGVCV